ncbi:hypothetical protein MIMGU_mgv1a004206mg [Erythranthe guttata]|uniref:WRKY19-like zinc finger domain-containing protein n=1 Tax=Erythranthe guttata TaxID=4155 RepID=A0A022QA46_ERYGU|nr:hypothetical protein MIMGU_mgv1a004206mg [Erythranthe guttata]
MDARFYNLGFAANPQSNAFKNLCNSTQIGGNGAEGVYCADTTLRLDSPAFPSPLASTSMGLKRKWSFVDGPENQQVESSLCLHLGHSSSSSDSKGSTATACTSMSSAKETDEESSMDLELDFTLHLGVEKPSFSEKSASFNLKSLNEWPKVDLQLGLSSGPALSDITTVHPFHTATNNAVNMGRTAFCKAHGGGRRCEFLGCTKSAEGRTDFCIAHGGGRRCSYETCTRAARGKSGLCIRHGGGKRCQVQNCSKSAEGLSGLCISHGGGRRCQYPECHKGAQGSTMFCKAHGGGKRCTHPGCKKGAEGSTSLCKGHGGGKRCSFQGGGLCPKSVHGGTLFCVAHGGGKRCAISECTRSARGRTDFCVRHGGGKRCKYEGCGKSAQGSTDFCKAHGDGKRCSWGSPGSEFGLGDNPCNTFARGKTGLCVSHGALVQDNRVHGGGTVGIVVQDFKAKKPVFTVEDGSVVMNSADCSNYFGYQPTHMPSGSNRSSGKVPEGRVHGGNLMALLAGGPGFNFPSGDMAGPSEPEKSFVTHQTWM